MDKSNSYSLKKALISLTLCVYVFGLVKPVLPIVKDAFAHSFFNTSHMATVHMENGRYHLHLELKAEADTETKHHNAAFNNETLSQHVKTETVCLEPFVQKVIELSATYTNVLKDVTLSLEIIPPEC